jgi:hypothetical protein
MKRLLPKKKVKQPPKRLVDHSTIDYEHAVYEYHQTVQPALSNDDGRLPQIHFLPLSPAPSSTSLDQEALSPRRPSAPMPSIQEAPSAATTVDTAHPQQYQQQQQTQSPYGYNNNVYPGIQLSMSESTSGGGDDHSMPGMEYPYHTMMDNSSLTLIPADATYEEFYGDAYVGAPLKYVYPNGYQSMRPRGGPWKLSIAICMLFTWLSIFIVGHCSKDTELDDDALYIDTKWCGSRLLYAMWVMSMLITGLSAAYCSVIGYIKVRDFAVANSRSQPPGMMGKSDYYPTVGDVKTNIYQADGAPQFWGGHIYRPTQAAVAVTSR